MHIGAYLTGQFGQSQQLYEVRNAEKRGRGNTAAVIAQARADTRKLLEAQAALSFVTDPLLLCDSILEPFFNVSGVSVGAQENWFNNNLFYRCPVLPAQINPYAVGFAASAVDIGAVASTDKGMVILPSPYTLLMLSDIPGGADRRHLVADLATLLRNEAEFLVARGIVRIQYDEPVLAHRQSLGSRTSEDLDLLQIAMEICGKIQGATTSLHTYFGDAGPLLPHLNRLPVDCIGIDATETKLPDIIAQSFANKELALGLVNARSAVREDPVKLAKALQRIAAACQPTALWITPNTGTTSIGWTYGLEKLAVLKQTVAEANHG